MDTLSRASICKRAIANLQQGTEAYYSALAELPSCSAMGARALRSEWEQPPSDTTAVRLLGEVTPRLRDRQVFDAVLRSFSDPVRPRELLLAALEALMGYYEPGLGARYVEPALAVQHGGAYVMMGQGDPVAAYPGPAPLGAGSRGEILQVLEQVGKEDPDERVRLISTYIHSRLSALSTAEQKDSAAPTRRAYCERARQTFRADRPSSEKVQSMVTMQQCGDAGVETLVSYWRQPAVDTVLLPALTDASARINDRRTYQAARAVVLDPSRPEAVRLGALTVLVAGFDPNIAVSFPTPTKPMYSSYVGIGFISHASKRKGPQPVEPGAKADLISILKQLAGFDPNERMRKVAAELGPLLDRRSTNASAPAVTAQSTTSGCLTGDQERALARISFLRELVSSPDSDHAASRRHLGIGKMDSRKVTLVTRRRDCQKAVNALNGVRQEPGTVRQIWLYALGGQGYAIDDPGLDVGFSNKVLYFFGPKFKYKVTYSGF